MNQLTVFADDLLVGHLSEGDRVKPLSKRVGF